MEEKYKITDALLSQLIQDYSKRTIIGQANSGMHINPYNSPTVAALMELQELREEKKRQDK